MATQAIAETAFSSGTSVAATDAVLGQYPQGQSGQQFGNPQIEQVETLVYPSVHLLFNRRGDMEYGAALSQSTQFGLREQDPASIRSIISHQTPIHATAHLGPLAVERSPEVARKNNSSASQGFAIGVPIPASQTQPSDQPSVSGNVQFRQFAAPCENSLLSQNIAVNVSVAKQPCASRIEQGCLAHNMAAATSHQTQAGCVADGDQYLINSSKLTGPSLQATPFSHSSVNWGCGFQLPSTTPLVTKQPAAQNVGVSLSIANSIQAGTTKPLDSNKVKPLPGPSSAQGYKFGQSNQSSSGFKYDQSSPSNNCKPSTQSLVQEFKFGQSDSSSGGFKFGQSSPSNVFKPPTSGAKSGQSSPSDIFKFGQSDSSSGGFKFGQSSPSNVFKPPTSSAKSGQSSPSDIFKLGQSSVVQEFKSSQSHPSEVFKFGQSNSSSGGFKFGQSSPSNEFKLLSVEQEFKSDQSNSSAGGFKFGQSSMFKSPTPSPKSGQSSPSELFKFGQSDSSSGGFKFGQWSPSDEFKPPSRSAKSGQSNPSDVFKFGQSVASNEFKPLTPSVVQESKSSQPNSNSGGFNFGRSSPSNEIKLPTPSVVKESESGPREAFRFGQSNSSLSGFKFGQSGPSDQSLVQEFKFGQPSPSEVFKFGQSNSSSGSFKFDQSSTSNKLKSPVPHLVCSLTLTPTVSTLPVDVSVAQPNVSFPQDTRTKSKFTTCKGRGL
ncbi:hypothetical protein EMCRGX_G016138 [Ephydatia muelleri]|eukprot:Em0008g1061a